MKTLPNSPHAKDIEYLLHPYSNLAAHEKTGPLIIEKSQGVRVTDTEGKEYIEAMAGLWCVSLGFDEQRLIDAAVKQMKELPYYHLFNSKSHPVAIDLAERLVNLYGCGMSKALFACSGSEANDTAIKIIRYYHNAIGKPEKKKIISRWRAYHGVTLASASLTGLPPVHADFNLPIDGVLHTECPFYYRYHEDGESESAFTDRMIGEIEAMIERENPDTIAAFFAEPIMGAGGVIIPPEGYFEKLQKLLKKHDILFVADEVITGFGRLGTMFGAHYYNLQPDIATMAKALSSGYQPISATLVNDKVAKVVYENSGKIGTFGHGYTYSGHPVPAAVAVETLKIYEERDIVNQVNNVAGDFATALESLYEFDCVGNVRSCGLIGAIDLVKDKETRTYYEPSEGVAMKAANLALKHGLFTRAIFGDVLAFCPPLTITKPDIVEMGNRMAAALKDLENEIR